MHLGDVKQITFRHSSETSLTFPFSSDIDECEDAKGGCSHECVNNDGGFNCTCPEPLKLSDDNRNCRGE